jgi:hypothetical protein
MPHPGDDRGLGALFDRNTFSAGHGTGTDRRGVIGYRASESVR